MKRFFYISVGLATLLVLNSCPTQLNKYDPKNDAENKITDLLKMFIVLRYSSIKGRG